jgi:hypothetical protein
MLQQKARAPEICLDSVAPNEEGGPRAQPVGWQSLSGRIESPLFGVRRLRFRCTEVSDESMAVRETSSKTKLG